MRRMSLGPHGGYEYPVQHGDVHEEKQEHDPQHRSQTGRIPVAIEPFGILAPGCRPRKPRWECHQAGFENRGLKGGKGQGKAVSRGE